MIHRFQVEPPQTTVLIHAAPNREDRERPGGTMFEVDYFINTRMHGGRNQFGEFERPCLITIDDETETGRRELAMLQARLADGKLPGVSPFVPDEGMSDEMIEAMIERRVAERLAAERGRAEAPSEEARELLEESFEPDEATSIAMVLPIVTGQSATPVSVVDAPVLTIERSKDGRLRCPLDRRIFKEGQAWTVHWQRSEDPEHQRLAPQMINPF